MTETFGMPLSFKGNDPQSEVEETSFVPKYFVMDPETDDLLFDGTFLENGMIVLIASSDVREEVEWLEASSDPDLRKVEKSRKYNRWCTVSDVQIGGPYYSNERVSFIGTFDDGTKVKFSEHVSHSWYVKKDSIPELDEKYEPLSEQDIEKMIEIARKVEFARKVGLEQNVSLRDVLKNSVWLEEIMKAAESR